MKKNIINAVIIFVGIILIVLVINAQYNKVNLADNSSGQIFVNGSLVNGTNSTGSDEISQRDMSFLRWAQMVSKSMRSHVANVANATKIDDYNSIEQNGSSMNKDAVLYLNQSTSLEISPMMQTIFEDIKKSLENYKLAGEYLEKGGREHSNDSLNKAANYAMIADRYMKNATDKAMRRRSSTTLQ